LPLISEVGRKKLNVRLMLISITIFLWIGVGLHLFPVWWMFTSSLKGNIEIFEFPPTLWPRHVYWGVYGLLLRGASLLLPYSIWVYLKNSLIMVGAIMVTQIPISALVAYSLSKLMKPKWSRLMFLFFAGALMIPAHVNIIPLYLLMRYFPFVSKITTSLPSYNFVDTYLGVIFPGMVGAFNILLFKGFFDGIPDELINAARLDGASEITIFYRIIIRLSKPVFAVVGYLTFSSAWNNFMWPLIIFKSENKLPLSLAIYKAQEKLSMGVVGGRGSILAQPHAEGFLGWNGVMALALIESIPVFIGFIIFREQLMKGIKLRGFK